MKLFLIVSLAFTLATPPVNAENNVRLHGKIIKPIADSISVRFNSDRIIYNPKTYATQIKSDGTFELTFPIVENFTELKLRHGNQQTDLVVASGNDIEIMLDAEDFDASLHYSGKGSAEANFCALHERKSGELMNFGLHIQPLYVKEPADFEKSIDSLCQTELDFLNSNNKGLSTDFVKYWAAYFQYDCYAKKLVYPVFHEMRKQHTNHIDSIPKEYYIVVSHVPEAFDDELLGCSNYRLYLERLFQEKLNAAGVKNTYGSDIPSVKYKFADSVLTLTYTKMPPKTAEYTAAKHLYSNSKFEALDRSEEELKIFKSHFPESGYLPAINSAIAIQNKLDKGNNAIDFTIHTIDGKTMKLSDLKGKVVLTQIAQ